MDARQRSFGVRFTLSPEFLCVHLDIIAILHVYAADLLCGKTTLMKVTKHLCHKGYLCPNVTEGNLYRIVEEWAPSLLVDEAHKILAMNPALHGMFCAASDRDLAHVPRRNENTLKMENFPFFGAKGLATIKELDD